MENVMLNSIQTQIKIVDFGLSNLWSPDSSLRTHCGSPEYAAPELFVTGKQYGPEVDLWSLGIILYGMVVGQLPFVCGKTECLSSQERRKKLVLQINRGLVSNQKRALASFSSDFRQLVNMLLNADASKRMNVKELITHPWITEKGKKYIRTNPIKNLDKQWHAKILSEIAALNNVELETVVESMKAEPLGKVAGMYQILSHRCRLNQLNGDGVTKNMSTLGFGNILEGDPSLTKICHMTTRHSISRPVSSSNPFNDAVQSKVPKRESKEIIQPTVDYRQIKSPTLRRKAYSATINPTNYKYRSSDTQDMNKSNIKTMNTPRRLSEENDCDQDLRLPVTRPLSLRVIKPPVGDITTQTPRTKKEEIKITPQQTIDYRQMRSPTLRRKAYSATVQLKMNRSLEQQDSASAKKTASDQNSNVRKKIEKPVGSNRQFMNKDLSYAIFLEEPKSRIKTRSQMISEIKIKRPMTVPSHKLNEKGNKSDGTIGITQTKPNYLKVATSSNRTNCKYAYGEPGSIENSKYGSPIGLHKKPLIYDPIAKSIADFVVNNTPDYYNNFKNLKK